MFLPTKSVVVFKSPVARRSLEEDAVWGGEGELSESNPEEHEKHNSLLSRYHLLVVRELIMTNAVTKAMNAVIEDDTTTRALEFMAKGLIDFHMNPDIVKATRLLSRSKEEPNKRRRFRTV